jgi:hypothetical protein
MKILSFFSRSTTLASSMMRTPAAQVGLFRPTYATLAPHFPVGQIQRAILSTNTAPRVVFDRISFLHPNFIHAIQREAVRYGDQDGNYLQLATRLHEAVAARDSDAYLDIAKLLDIKSFEDSVETQYLLKEINQLLEDCSNNPVLIHSMDSKDLSVVVQIGKELTEYNSGKSEPGIEQIKLPAVISFDETRAIFLEILKNTNPAYLLSRTVIRQEDLGLIRLLSQHHLKLKELKETIDTENLLKKFQADKKDEILTSFKEMLKGGKLDAVTSAKITAQIAVLVLLKNNKITFANAKIQMDVIEFLFDSVKTLDTLSKPITEVEISPKIIKTVTTLNETVTKLEKKIYEFSAKLEKLKKEQPTKEDIWEILKQLLAILKLIVKIKAFIAAIVTIYKIDEAYTEACEEQVKNIKELKDSHNDIMRKIENANIEITLKTELKKKCQENVDNLTKRIAETEQLKQENASKNEVIETLKWYVNNWGWKWENKFSMDATLSATLNELGAEKANDEAIINAATKYIANIDDSKMALLNPEQKVSALLGNMEKVNSTANTIQDTIKVWQKGFVGKPIFSKKFFFKISDVLAERKARMAVIMAELDQYDNRPKDA